MIIITRPRPKAGGRVLKWAPFVFRRLRLFFVFLFLFLFLILFLGLTSGLMLIDKFHVVSRGGLDCRCRPSLFSLEKETPSRGPLFSGLKLWQNFYRVDCSDEETVGHSETDV